MSRNELLEAYVAGKIGRRGFIQGLVALGVSMSAATAHAAALRPAAATGKDDYYNKPTDKDQCKNGGYKKFGFRNQGECIAYVNNHKR
jgi:hypothetical protein